MYGRCDSNPSAIAATAFARKPEVGQAEQVGVSFETPLCPSTEYTVYTLIL